MGELPYDVVFTRKGLPDAAALKRSLGKAFALYQQIQALTENISHEWKFYGTKYGWQEKALQKGRALYYLVPLANSFRIGFGVREDERELLLKSKLPAKAKEELRTVKKYPEGYPLRFVVSRTTDLKPVRLVIETLLSMRS
jgi:hypothetical protein